MYVFSTFFCVCNVITLTEHSYLFCLILKTESVFCYSWGLGMIGINFQVYFEVAACFIHHSHWTDQPQDQTLNKK